MNELALFAGAGGGLLASKLLGWNTVAACEIAQYPRDILLQRQRDGHLEPFPIWDDVRTFDGKPWRGLVDVVSGGFPCQDISVAGRGEGLTGSRSGLWFEYLRIVDEVRPRFVFAENSPNLRTRGLGTIIKGLASLGYDTRWCVLGAGHLGALHQRSRMWVVAHANSVRDEDARSEKTGTTPPTMQAQIEERERVWPKPRELADHAKRTRRAQPPMGRVVDGYPGRVDELTAIGNGQVPAVAATAFKLLHGGTQ